MQYLCCFAVTYDTDEVKDLLACFLYIIKSLKPAVLLQWLQSKSIELSFLDILLLCVRRFEYVGRDNVTRDTSAMSATAQRLKYVPYY
jgi:hypothetical protein